MADTSRCVRDAIVIDKLCDVHRVRARLYHAYLYTILLLYRIESNVCVWELGPMTQIEQTKIRLLQRHYEEEKKNSFISHLG